MPSFWQRLFRAKEQTSPTGLTLIDYAENYLSAFEAGSKDEKTRHATKLYEAANDAARQAGCTDFVALLKARDRPNLRLAAQYSRDRFDEITKATQGGYWLSAYALTHLMILNSVKLLEDNPRAKLIATNAAHLHSLYLGAYAARPRPPRAD